MANISSNLSTAMIDKVLLFYTSVTNQYYLCNFLSPLSLISKYFQYFMAHISSCNVRDFYGNKDFQPIYFIIEHWKN